MSSYAQWMMAGLLCTTSIVACSKKSDSSQSESPATTVSGRVVKGVVANAKIAAYSVATPPMQLAEGRTDSHGDYQLRLPDGYQAPVYLVAETDEQSEITCDTSKKCATADDSLAAFGERYAPKGTVTLAAMLPKVLPDSDNAANITAFSNMAAAPLLQSLVTGRVVTADEILESNRKITTLLNENGLFDFDGRGDVVAVRPVDITQTSEIAAEKDAWRSAGVQLGFASAAIANLAQTEATPGDLDAVISNFSGAFVAGQGALPSHKIDYTTSVPNSASVQALVDASLEEMSIYNRNENAPRVANMETTLKRAQDHIIAGIPTSTPDITPTPEPAPTNDNRLVIELPPELMPVLPDLANSDAATFLKTTGKTLLAPLRALAHAATDVENGITGALTTATGLALTSNLNNDAYNIAGVAKKFYPHLGALINAIVAMGEDKAYTLSYDLARDPDNLLPKGIAIRGTVTRTNSWSRRFVLNDGYIEGLGNIKLDLTVYSSYCYYCYYNYSVYFTASVTGANGDISVSSYNVGVNRFYNYSTGRYLPYQVDIRSATTDVAIHDGSVNVHTSGNSSLGLQWPSYDAKKLPVVTSFTVQGDYRRYDYTKDIRIPAIYVTYTNEDSWKSQGFGVVDWAQRQADYFTLMVGLKAQIKTIPGSYFSPYRDINIEFGMSRVPYGPYDPVTYVSKYDYRREWVQFGTDKETYKFENTLTNSPRFAFYTQSGAMVKMLMNNDGKSLNTGDITYRGNTIATIANSKAGPIVRFPDGTIQSF